MNTITATNRNGEKRTAEATVSSGSGVEGYHGCDASDLGLAPGEFPSLVYLTTSNGVTMACDRGGMLSSNREPYAVVYHGRDQRSGVVLFND